MTEAMRVDQAMDVAIAYLEKRCERGDQDGVRVMVERDDGAITEVWEIERDIRELTAKGYCDLCKGSGLRTIKLDGVRTKVLCECPQAEDWAREDGKFLTVPLIYFFPGPAAAPVEPQPS
jgi:hypothetical protein